MAPPDKPVAVLAMPRAARGGNELTELLGATRRAALEQLLSARLLEWAGELAPGRVFAVDLPGADLSLTSALVDAAAQALGGDAAQALRGDDGPLLIAWPDLATWRAEHFGAAVDDLGDGCDLSIGPVFDGGFYLLALARPLVVLPQFPDRIWPSPDALALAFALAHEAGLDAGMLRAERGLHSAADVRAALADPLLDGKLRRLLNPAA